MALRSSSSNNGGTSGTPTVPVPTGVAIDDIIILVMSADGTIPTKPTGFTTLDTSAANFGPDGQTVRIDWKRATAADTGNYTYGTTTVAWSVQAFCYSGRDTVNPPTAGTKNTPATLNTATVTANANTVTALSGDDLLWVAGIDVNGTQTVSASTPPTGYTAGLRNNNTGGFGGGISATKDNVAAGATGTVSATYTLSGTVNSDYTAWLVRIPAGATGAPITGTASAAGSTSGGPAVQGVMAGSAAGAGGVSGQPQVRGVMAGAAAATGAATGAPLAPAIMSGTAAAAGIASGTLHVTAVMGGSAGAAGALAGAPLVAGVLSGACAAAGSAAGSPIAAGTFAGSAAATGNSSGSLTVPGVLAGAAAAAGVSSGQPLVSGQLSGSAGGTGSTTGSPTAGTPPSGPTLVQEQGFFSTSADTSLQQAFDGDVQEGDLIVVAYGHVGGSVTSIADDLGTVYHDAVPERAGVGGGYGMGIAYGIAPAPGPNTVTVTINSPATYRRLAIAEYGGVDTLDQAGFTDGHSNTLDSSSFTTLFDHEVLFSWDVSNSGYSAPGTGWTQRVTVGSEATQDQIDVPAGTYQSTATGGFDNWTVMYATFYLAGVAGAAISGTADAAGSASGQPIAAAVMAGAAAGAGAGTAQPRVTAVLSGFSSAQGACAGSPAVSGVMVGSCAGAGATSGTPRVSAVLSGAASAAGAAAGTLLVRVAASSTFAGGGGTVGSPGVPGQALIAGTAAASGSATGQPGTFAQAVSTFTAASSSSGQPSVSAALVGAAAGQGAAQGTAVVAARLAGSAAGAGVCSGVFVVAVFTAGSTDAVSDLTGAGTAEQGPVFAGTVTGIAGGGGYGGVTAGESAGRSPADQGLAGVSAGGIAGRTSGINR